MKRAISYFLFISCLMAVTPLHAATQTLTTYYPAPNGDYNKLRSTSFQLTASNLTAIQAQYHCSYDATSGLQPCPAGLVFFDTVSQTIFVSTATHWSTLNATCVPVTECPANGCSSDSCGDLCGNCVSPKTCSSSTEGTPGICN